MMRSSPVLLALGLAAACGKVHALADGGGPDTRDEDAAVVVDHAVAVTVFAPNGSRAPSAGIPVVFSNPDGSTAATATTDVDGKAKADLPDGGSVTAVWLTAQNQYVIETIAGAKPGDDLVLVGSGADNTQIGTYTIGWPALAGANFYDAFNGCGPHFLAGATAVATPVQAACKRDTFTAAAAAFDATGTLIGYLEKPGVTYVDGGTTTLAGTWQPPQTFIATFTNLDDTAEGGISVDRFTDDRFGFDASMGVAVAGTTASLNPKAPSSAGKALVRTTVSHKNAPGNAAQTFYQLISGNSFAYNLDIGAHLMPWVEQPVLDPATATITVHTTGTGAADLAVLDVPYGRTVGQTTTFFDWIVIAPGVDQPIKLPSLPVAVGDVVPRAGDSVGTTIGSTTLLESDAITGYDQIRADAFGALDLATTGHAGTSFVRVSSATPSE